MDFFLSHSARNLYFSLLEVHSDSSAFLARNPVVSHVSL